MEAGVVDYKICRVQDFNCEACEFDKAMSATAACTLKEEKTEGPPSGAKAPADWEAKMKEHFPGEQKCQLMMSSLCHQCSFDELLEEQFDFFLSPKSPRVQEVFGVSVPTFNFLHRGHTWVALENAGRVRIGLDDFCQKILGPADRISLPQVGKKIHADQVALTFYRQGKKAPILAPVHGVIEAVNPKVMQRPSLAHDDPYGEGWLMLVSPTNLKPDLEKMLFGQCNVAWVEHESHRLLGMLESSLGITLPCGGGIIDDLIGRYHQLGWQRLVREFLHSV
jgi:glycine cleavage system H lipoate-binding protein